MRRRAHREPQPDDTDEAAGSWAVLVEVDCDGQAQVVAAGTELNPEITSGPLVRVLAAVVDAAQHARGNALLRVVEPGGVASLVVARDGQVVPAGPALAELDVT